MEWRVVPALGAQDETLQWRNCSSADANQNRSVATCQFRNILPLNLGLYQ